MENKFACTWDGTKYTHYIDGIVVTPEEYKESMVGRCYRLLTKHFRIFGVPRNYPDVVPKGTIVKVMSQGTKNIAQHSYCLSLCGNYMVSISYPEDNLDVERVLLAEAIYG